MIKNINLAVILVAMMTGTISKAQTWGGSTTQTGNTFRTGYVGIGATPIVPLHLIQNCNYPTNPITDFRLEKFTNYTTNRNYRWDFNIDLNSGNLGFAHSFNSSAFTLPFLLTPTSVNVLGDFNVGNTGLPANRFTILSNGNVGVGIANPLNQFQVGNSFNVNNGSLLTNNITSLISFQNLGTTTLNNGLLVTSGLSNLQGLSVNGNTTVTGTSTLNGNTSIKGFLEIKNAAGTANEFKVDQSGNVRARKVKVDVGIIPDYVFQPDYKLLSLDDLKVFITLNKHLPNVPSEQEYKERGEIDLTELNLKLLEKVEELTLYILHLEQRINIIENTKNGKL
jgi:hypothetical protein